MRMQFNEHLYRKPPRVGKLLMSKTLYLKPFQRDANLTSKTCTWLKRRFPMAMCSGTCHGSLNPRILSILSNTALLIPQTLKSAAEASPRQSADRHVDVVGPSHKMPWSPRGKYQNLGEHIYPLPTTIPLRSISSFAYRLQMELRRNCSGASLKWADAFSHTGGARREGVLGEWLRG